MRRGRLRVLLGAAPGVGKTYSMLEEGRRLRGEGRDVVVAFVETHGRKATASMVSGLEVLPRATIEHRGMGLEEMDLDAVLARRPSSTSSRTPMRRARDMPSAGRMSTSCSTPAST